MFAVNPVAAATTTGTKLSIGTSALYALLGYAVVFVGLVLLMVVIIIVGKIMVASQKKKAAPAVAAPATPAVPAAAAPALSGEVAPGSAGGVKIYDVSERDAAIIMAIVADQIGKPLNEIRFKSIKEVK